jgi:hypothetical protein
MTIDGEAGVKIWEVILEKEDLATALESGGLP